MNNERLNTAIEDFQKGNDEAFSLIYELQYKHVYFIALQYCKKKEDAEDVTQEVFIQIYKSLRDLRDVNNYNAWINKIVHTYFIRSKRNKSETMRVDLGPEVNLEAVIADGEVSNPQEVYHREELMVSIETNFNKLSGPNQEVARLRYYDELSINEISDVLAIPKGTVKSRLNTVRNQFMANLEDKSVLHFKASTVPLLYAFFKVAIESSVSSVPAAPSNIALMAAGATALKPKKVNFRSPNVLSLAAVGVLGIVGLNSALSQDLSLVDIHLDTAWSSGPLEARVLLSDDALDSLNITLDDKALSFDQDGAKVTVSIPQNGLLEISVAGRTLHTQAVANIDKISPELSSLEKVGTTLHFKVLDEGSGFDSDSISVTDDKGLLISHKVEGEKISFEFTEGVSYFVSGSDLVGNPFSYSIEAQIQ